MHGYRKFSIALISILVPSALLIAGYDVSKLGWLSTPLAAFYGANLIEYIPKLMDKYKEYKEIVEKIKK